MACLLALENWSPEQVSYAPPAYHGAPYIPHPVGSVSNPLSSTKQLATLSWLVQPFSLYQKGPVV